MRLIELSAAHHPDLERALTAEPVHHLLLLARMSRLGRDPGVAFWALVGGRGYGAVLAQDGGDWFLANPGRADLYPFAGIVAGRGGARLRGEAEAVNALARHLRSAIGAGHACLVVRLGGENLPEEVAHGATAKITRPGQALDPADLWSPGEPGARSLLLRGLAGGGRAAIVPAGERTAAVAWTEAEYGRGAAIGGVYTAPAFRRLGFGRAALWSLCRALLADGLAPQLAYDCPHMGRLAGELGFTPYGRWRELDLCAPQSAQEPEI